MSIRGSSTPVRSRAEEAPRSQQRDNRITPNVIIVRVAASVRSSYAKHVATCCRCYLSKKRLPISDPSTRPGQREQPLERIASVFAKGNCNKSFCGCPLKAYWPSHRCLLLRAKFKRCFQMINLAAVINDEL